jgi:hypothetical protein
MPIILLEIKTAFGPEDTAAMTAAFEEALELSHQFAHAFAVDGHERIAVLGARRQVRRRAFAPDRKSSLSIRCSDRHRASGGVCF